MSEPSTSENTTSTRPSIDDYFLGFARQAAMRATCLRKKVGAVIARDGILLSTGYNGSIRGMPHCTDEGVGCLMEDNHCCRTVHAEINAVLQAAKNGVRIDGATLYVTASPCWPCFSAIANAGIKRIVFGEAYRATDPGPKRVIEVAQQVGIELVDFTTIPAELKTAPRTRYYQKWAGGELEVLPLRTGRERDKR